jgi:hypothetical protein
VIRELRVAVPSERTAIIGKNHREDQACLEKRSGQPPVGLVPAEAELGSYQPPVGLVPAEAELSSYQPPVGLVPAEAELSSYQR